MSTERNEQLRQAWDFVEHTGRSIFLTGKAGTGKTTFLKTVVERSKKQMVVVAPTGVAAINAGGVTIHSFFQLPLSPYLPGAKVKQKYDFSKEKRKIISSLDLLIIDEISMVRSDLLDAIDNVLRRYRDGRLPFGGVQLLMIGDLAQLTPVVTPEDEEVLHGYYDTPYFFGSKALQKIDYVTIQLQKIYRQADAAFVDILNHIREGVATAEDFATLDSRYNPDFRPKVEEGYIRLTTHNRTADEYNDSEMKTLATKPFTYRAEIEGTFPEMSYPTAEYLTLKVGAQVMFVKNDTDGKFFNGKIGRVVELDDEMVRVLCTGEETPVDVVPLEWENSRYSIDEKTREIKTEVMGVFRQYPLRLAWAITIHKSQGLTFDRAIIDAGRSFAPGQVYVALSRCRSLQGVVIASKITPSAIISDETVERYIDRQEIEAERSITQLPDLKRDYYRRLMLELFDFTRLQTTESYMLRLMMEFFSSMNPELLQMHRQAVETFRTDIADIAAKWTAGLASMSHEKLNSEPLLERVRNSAGYFRKKIEEVFERLLEVSKKLQSNNKEAMRRYDDTLSSLTQLCRFHILLLEAIGQKGFSIEIYLKEKQRSQVMAMEKPERKRREKEKKPKEEKEKTWVTSYKLYKEGKSVDEVASIRGLNRSTIAGHLGRYIETGEIALEELVPPEHISIIRKAIQQAGTADGRGAIKALCPDDVTYDEIDNVLRVFNSTVGVKEVNEGK